MNHTVIFKDTQALKLIQASQEQCAPNHHFSYYLKDSYLIHFIVNGKGKYRLSGKEYTLTPGYAFLIPPENYAYYEADKDQPWHYMWFQFSGNTAQVFLDKIGLCKENPIYRTNNIKEIENSFAGLFSSENSEIDFLSAGAFYTLLGNFIKYSFYGVSEPKKSEQQYIYLCKEFIKLNLHRPITVSELCNVVSLDRTYLYRLFIKHTGMSPKEYIIDSKLTLSKKMLAETNFNVTKTAAAVGYEDVFAFSKLFKSRFNVSPSEFGKKAEL